VIPLRDVIPSRTTPVVTLALIAINAIVFLLEQTLPAAQLNRLLVTYGFVPASFSAITLVTSMFLHADWGHVAGNLLCLWIFGDNVEDRFGHRRFLLFYLAAGVVASLADAWLLSGSQVPAIGASGAIAAVMGAYLILFPTSRVQVLIWFVFFVDIVEIPAVFFLGFWFLLQMVGGLGSLGGAAGVGGVAFWAHVGGFLTGLLAAKLLAQPERQHADWWG
jgi:membrane associated rhomboid family serine protease